MTITDPQNTAILPLGPVFNDAQPLLLQASVLRAAKACIESCEGQFPASYQRDQSALLVAASGAYNPEVNANLVKLSRMLWEGLGFGWATVGFAGSTWPPIFVSLEHIYRLDFRHIVVFPCVFSTDNQFHGVSTLMDALQSAHLDVTVVLALTLGAHLVPRQTQMEKGAGLCNCFQCNYRSSHNHARTPHAVNTPGHHHP
jgi:sirohydrochlorin cobaltochelatase